jgi:N utilization substance protein A
VNLGKVEGILPKSEKVRGENYHIGERLRALVLEVKKSGPKVKVILSRAHKDLVRRLFHLEVPEISEKIIEIRKVEREPGYRTKLAVTSTDPKIDCVGACVGVRGTRIKSIIDELNGEKIDIIRWNDDPEILITNALKPATISQIELDHGNRKALVLVEEDQLSLAIGRKGQNVRLASKLCGWDIDIMTRAELEATLSTDDAKEKAGGPDGSAPSDQAPSDQALAPAGEPAADPEQVTATAAAEPAADAHSEPAVVPDAEQDETARSPEPAGNGTTAGEPASPEAVTARTETNGAEGGLGELDEHAGSQGPAPATSPERADSGT